jgi:hypothetical protein
MPDSRRAAISDTIGLAHVRFDRDRPVEGMRGRLPAGLVPASHLIVVERDELWP